ncbi:alpha/beta fold hydrolase [Rhizosaccharibacter radicis]|uniref:Alpha/beta fold hydrolase n=1 Tax=Rhizosaccharibacter radicis TaxID=2782605 RepID=A0ABT1VX83_9PROT|nr:alpha/beta fold hydrolase [Acetobacteraceae bacterium KSS12]
MPPSGSGSLPPPLDPAVLAEAADPLLLAGIAAYRRHPCRREMADPPVVWSGGSSRLLDYGPDGGVPVLVIPSLVNRGYILDLGEQNSMLRAMSARGLRPLLMEWGWPGEEERRFDVGDYITRRLEPALESVRARTDRIVSLLGYCMGGTMAVALAQRRAADVGAMALLAAPWNFHAGTPDAPGQAEALLQWAAPVMDAIGTMPIDMIQAAFASLEPDGVLNKFRAFGAQPQDGPRAALFVAMEDWLNDGVPLSAPVARECLGDWYGRNLPARDAWFVGGTAIRPADLRVPSLVVVPERDRIVPPGSAGALAEMIPGAVQLRLPAGHVGMVAGNRGPALLWRPLADWLLEVAEVRENSDPTEP